MKTKQIITILICLVIKVGVAQSEFDDEIRVNQVNNSYPSLSISAYQGLYPQGHPHIFMQNLGGTETSKLPTPSGSFLGTMIYAGYDGQTSVHVARISVSATDTFSSGYYPAKMNFQIGGTGTCCGINRMTIDGQTGNVGIGTTAPEEKLHVLGDALIEQTNGRSIKIDGYHGIETSGQTHWLHLNRYSDDNVAIGYNSTANVYLVQGGGNVGIGTTAPDSKLTVKGKIHAEEVKIDLSVPAPDYVFTKDYELLTLNEVQQHIAEKGHLPNIPSAKELETHGVELGVMNMKLLEKIEELMLYTIAQEEKIGNQEIRNRKLEIALQQQETINQELETKNLDIETRVQYLERIITNLIKD